MCIEQLPYPSSLPSWQPRGRERASRAESESCTPGFVTSSPPEPDGDVAEPGSAAKSCKRISGRPGTQLEYIETHAGIRIEWQAHAQKPDVGAQHNVDGSTFSTAADGRHHPREHRARGSSSGSRVRHRWEQSKHDSEHGRREGDGHPESGPSSATRHFSLFPARTVSLRHLYHLLQRRGTMRKSERAGADGLFQMG